MTKFLKWLLGNNSEVAVIEYGLLIALIGTVIITTVLVFHH